MSKPLGARLLPGAFAFLGLVLYVNLRLYHEMNLADWIVCSVGALFFLGVVARLVSDLLISGKRR